MKKASLAAVLVVLVSVMLAPGAEATFPGRNGKIVYADGERINLINADGTGHRAIGPTFGSFAEAPQVSSDGQWIVFDANAGTNTDLYVIRTNGKGFKRLTKTTTYEWSPSWSPDGKHIVYAQNGGGSQIMVMNADGTHRHKVGTAVGEYPRYSPNGKKIAYGSIDQQVHVMNADGSNDHAVTSSAGSDYPDWSPSGKQLVYTKHVALTHDLWVINLNGSGDTQITTSGNVGQGGVWSPDGKWIAYEAGSSLLKIKPGSGSPQTVTSLVATDCCLGWQAT